MPSSPREMPAENPVARLLAANNLLLAPMAGVTEPAFRGICKRFGAGLTCTEMVSARALHFNPRSRTTHELLTFAPAEVPCAVQLLGSEPELLAEAARLMFDLHAEKIALFDLNAGCPVSKVVARGEGAALMRDPERAAECVRALVSATPLPVTAKFRAGWDAECVNAVEFAIALEEAGASALTVHGRTRGQMYRGRSDAGVVAAAKSAVRVPVVASGDVFSAADAVRILAETGADAVMIARGAQGNPWIFRETRALLDAGEPLAQPSALERVAVAREHAWALDALDPVNAAKRMRGHVIHYVSGLPGATHVRVRVNSCATVRQLDELLGEYAEWLERL